jgi:hypothetical protein
VRKVKFVFVTAIAAFSLIGPFTGQASAVVCHEDPGSCCADPVILGKEYNLWDC